MLSESVMIMLSSVIRECHDHVITLSEDDNPVIRERYDPLKGQYPLITEGYDPVLY